MTSENAKVVMQFLLDALEQEMQTTAKVLSAMPSGHDDYRPAEKCMTAIDLAWHIAAADLALLRGTATGQFDFSAARPAELGTGTQISGWYLAEMPKAIAALRELDGEACAAVIEAGGGWAMPRVGFLQVTLAHGIHHRGQLSAYLRPMGGKVPSIYGGSADEPTMAAGA